MKSRCLFAVLLAGSVLWTGGRAAFSTPSAHVWIMSRDFSADRNPAGVWCYGCEKKLGTTFIPFNRCVTRHLWFATSFHAADRAPYVWKNKTGGIMDGVAAGQVGIHTGPAHAASGVRWTAPRNGAIEATGYVGGGPVAIVDAYLQVDGRTAWKLLQFRTRHHFKVRRTVTAGDTVDVLVVGYMNGDTPIDATVRYTAQ